MPRPSLYLGRWRKLKELARARGGVVTMTQAQLAAELGASLSWVKVFLVDLSTFRSAKVTSTRGRYAMVQIAINEKPLVEPPNSHKRKSPATTTESVNQPKTGMVVGPPNSQKQKPLAVTEENGQLARNGSYSQKPLPNSQKPISNSQKPSKWPIGNVLQFPRNSSPTRTQASAHGRALKYTQTENTEPKPSLRSGAPSARESQDSNFQIALAAERGELPREDLLKFDKFKASRAKAQWAAVVEGTTRRLTAAYVARKAIATRRPKRTVEETHEKHASVFRRAALVALELLVEDERFTVDRLLDVAWDTKGAKFAAPIPNFLASSTMADKVREWRPPEERVSDDPNHREISSLDDMTPEERARHFECGRRNWYLYARLPMADVPPDDCDDLDAFYVEEARRLWREGVINPDEDRGMPPEIRRRVMAGGR